MRFLVFLTVFSLLLPSYASYGDRSRPFQDCVKKCTSINCPPKTSYTPSLALVLTRWTCPDDCNYTCMHGITDRDLAKGRRMKQYYGKWPFWRYLGMQEPASTLFSLMNLAMQVRGWKLVSRRLPKGHPMRSYYLTWSAISINTWFWSAVFHTRDKPLTEKLDYFSAALAIGYALYYTLIRFLHVYPSTRLSISPEDIRSKRLTRNAISVIFTLGFLGHISYLGLPPRFDYTYNVIFNSIVGVLHNLLWLLYSLPRVNFKRFPSKLANYRPKFAGQAAVFVVLTTLATSLELLDFEPWGRVVDAHSLWHAVTVPIGWVWYDFLIKDAEDEGWRGWSSAKD